MSDLQHTSPPVCQSFLVRIWQPHADAGWCFQLRSVDGSQRLMFDDPAALIHFMMGVSSAETVPRIPTKLGPAP